MANYLFEGSYKNIGGNVVVRLLLVHFQDEKGVHFVYSPHLDLTGYGNSYGEAKKSFKITMEDFVDYTVKKKTIGKVVTELGWKVKGSIKKPGKVIAPSISSIIGKNDHISEIFDKYPANTFHEEVGIPAHA